MVSHPHHPSLPFHKKRIKLLSLRRRETDLRGMIGTLLRILSRPLRRLIRTEVQEKLNTSIRGICIYISRTYPCDKLDLWFLTMIGLNCCVGLRLKPNKQKIFKSEVKEIDQNISLIKAPGSYQQEDSEKMKVSVSTNKSVQNEAMEEWLCGSTLKDIIFTLLWCWCRRPFKTKKREF